MIAHLASLIQGTALLALTRALDFSTLSSGAETLAAWLLLAGVALFGIGNTLNWRRGTNDAFRDRPPGQMVASIGTPMMLTRAVIVFVGVVRAA